MFMTAKNAMSVDMRQSSKNVGNAVLGNQQGNVMLPIVIAFTVIGILLQSSELNRIVQNSYLTKNLHIRDSRNSLAFHLGRYGSLPTSFRNSVIASDNVDLQNCLFGNGSSPCYADGREYPVKLLEASVDGAPAKIISGPGQSSLSQAQPVLYNDKGQLCETGATRATLTCPFEVTTTFKARCAAAATSCATAESIILHYHISTPQDLYSSDSSMTFRNPLILASVENTSTEVKVADILPPAYDFIPNAMTKVSYVVETIVDPGTTTTTTATVSYNDVYAAVLAAIGGSNTTLAQQIATSLFQEYHLTNLETIGAISLIWTQNQGVADRIADAISYRETNLQNYTPPTAAEIAEIAKVPLTIAPTNEQLARAIASGLYPDSVLNQQMADALANTTDYQTQQDAVSNRITSAAQAQALQTAIVTSGLKGDPSYRLAAVVAELNFTDASLLTTYAKVAVASGANEVVTSQIVYQGITDVNVAIQLMASQPAPTTATTTASTTTSISTTTQTTTATQTTTSSIVPVIYTTACTDITLCGTTIGM
jgi:hypothetical protein